MANAALRYQESNRIPRLGALAFILIYDADEWNNYLS